MYTKYLDEISAEKLIENLQRLGVELSEDQKRQLCYNDRTFLYAFKEEKKKNSILYRITIPLYWLWMLIVCLIIQPIKWIFTGSLFFDTRNPIYKFTICWRRKIFH